MKKNTVVTVFVSVLMFSSMLCPRLTLPVNAPVLHHVYPGESIQEAIDSAQPEDRVFVHEGIYPQVFVNKSLTLTGENANTTIIEGVRVHKASYVIISGFSIRRSINGIDLDNCTSIVISGNIVTDNVGYGIFVLNCSNIIISDNRILGDSARGVYLRYSRYNTVSNNTVSMHRQYGIILFHSSNNIISCNTISQMRFGAYGIYLAYSSGNSFFRNTIKNNDVGIVSQICGNNIYHNNFINNTIQVNALVSSNVWDHNDKGNYWSDYKNRYPDAEENPDNLGVWNTSYAIDENNVDRHPLMNPIAVECPLPTLVSVEYPTSIKLGEWATIAVVARNDGEMAEWQTIHIGFPSNPPLENIEIVNHDLSIAEPHPPMTVLPANYGEYNITSTYLMVEGVHEPWDYSEEHSMTVRIKPENMGTFTFYVKTVSRIEGVRPRPTNTKDQQDEYVYVYEINVQPVHDIAVLPPIKVSIMGIGVISEDTATVAPGEEVTIAVVVRNEGTVAENFTVTVYSNNKTINTQTVTNLAADNSETIDFIWDTTRTTEGSYIIKAEASQITGETDMEDNILISDVIVSVQESALPFFGLTILQIIGLVLLIIIIAALCFGAFVHYFKRKKT